MDQTQVLSGAKGWRLGWAARKRLVINRKWQKPLIAGSTHFSFAHHFQGADSVVWALPPSFAHRFDSLGRKSRRKTSEVPPKAPPGSPGTDGAERARTVSQFCSLVQFPVLSVAASVLRSKSDD